MEYLLNGIQMKTIDAVSINQYGIPSMVLMERAALAVATRIQEKICKEDSILVICTSGNNGGDGLAIARILTLKGYRVDVLTCGNFDRATEENRLQLHMVHNLGISVINNAKISSYNVVVDAMFGIGCNKPITGELSEVVEEVNNSHNMVFSVDIPSGIHAGSAQILGCAIKADYTITFGYRKIGLMLHPGYEYAGQVYCEEVGFIPKAIEQIQATTFTYDESDLTKVPVRTNRSNKGTYGKVLVIAGSPNMSGACYLSAKAAYRTGAGLVKILTAKENRIILQTALPEAILSTYDATTKDEELLQDIAWATTIVLGPGIGNSPIAERLLQLVVEHATVPVVLDADGLNILATRSDKEKVLAHLSNQYVLTPHLMEMSRLTDIPVSALQQNILQEAMNMVEKQQYTLVCKDARTVVARAGSEYINQSGNHGMATAGAGDVLTGIIAGLMAAGMSSYEAACMGVYIHGLSGDMGRKQKGAYSLMAEDILDGIGEVLKKVDSK